jgi:hypothetical protein
MQQRNSTTKLETYELTFLPDSGKGKLVDGKILRPETYKFTAVVDLLTQDFVVALTMAPSEGDPVYTEPVVVFVKFQLVDTFIKGLLAAQGLVAAEARKGGTI